MGRTGGDTFAEPVGTGTPFRGPERCPRRSGAQQEEGKHARPHSLDYYLAGFPGLGGNETADPRQDIKPVLHLLYIQIAGRRHIGLNEIGEILGFLPHEGYLRQR